MLFRSALGSATAMTISAIIGFIYFLKYGHLKICRPKIHWNRLLYSCFNGCSEMLTEISTGVITFLFNIQILKFHQENGVAAMSIIMFLYYFFIAGYFGIGVGSSPIISYNIGKGNYDKVNEVMRYSLITILVSSVFVTILALLLRLPLIRIFTDCAEVESIAMNGLFYFSFVFLFIGVNVFYSSYFTACGNGRISGIISLMRSLVFVGIFTIMLPVFIGVNGIDLKSVV